jgi:hypothetical protein
MGSFQQARARRNRSRSRKITEDPPMIVDNAVGKTILDAAE